MTDGSSCDHESPGGFPEFTSLSSGLAGKGLGALGWHSQPVFMSCLVISNACL